MRKVLFWSLFALFIFTGCTTAQQPKDTGEAFDPYTWDFGQVKEGQIVKHVFTLKNESRKPVRILDINSSCGCTVSEAEKTLLGPGESTAIEVKFDSRGYSGPVKQYVYVHTDNIDNQLVRFIIIAQVYK